MPTPHTCHKLSGHVNKNKRHSRQFVCLLWFCRCDQNVVDPLSGCPLPASLPLTFPLIAKKRARAWLIVSDTWLSSRYLETVYTAKKILGQCLAGGERSLFCAVLINYAFAKGASRGVTPSAPVPPLSLQKPDSPRSIGNSCCC